MSDTYEPRDGDLVNMTFQARVGSEAYRLALCNQVSVELIERADDPSKDPAGTVRRLPSGVVVAKKLWSSGSTGWLPFESDGVYNLDCRGAGEIIGAVPGTPAAEAELERARNGAGSAAGIYNWDEIYERKAPLSPEETEARALHLLHLYDTLTLELSYKWGEEKKERFLRKVEERHPYREGQVGQERPLWTGDGSEEPPAHVKKVRWLDFDPEEYGSDVAQRGSNGQWYWGLRSGAVGSLDFADMVKWCPGRYIEVRD